MPIKQNRMLKLIRAAKQFKDSYSLLAEEVQRAQGKEDSAAELARLLGVLAATAPEPKSYSIIDVEDYHFRKFAKRNDYERERQSGKRFEQKKDNYRPEPKRQIYKPALTEADLKAMLEKDYGEAGDVAKPEDLESGVFGQEDEP